MEMPEFDWSRFNGENNEHASEKHSQEEHDRAHSSQYEPVFQMAMARFEDNFEAFIKHYDDKDPHAKENFLHLFESAVVHALNKGVEYAKEHDVVFDEISSVYCAAGFGYILGRTLQEFEVKHLMNNGELVMIGQTVTTEEGTQQI
jgi:hypothetical protein